MASCLGLFIDNNIIKYAKVSKEHDNLKVESFGVEFYDKIDTAIKKIVEETYSYKTPISINLSNETYNYFEMFALLNKKDLPKAIKTEFESLCSDKGYNPNVFESRYALANDSDKEKIKVIHVSSNKIDLNKKTQRFEGYGLSGMYPIGMSISNLIDLKPKENYLIINIEDQTSIVTVENGKVNNVKLLEIGSYDFLSKLNLKENSYSKAYEVCKETTIYTSEGKNLGGKESQSLEDIMPVLYDIVGQVRKTINESLLKFDKVYITGTASLINNIDLYFEEYLEDVDCEILKPSFIKITPDMNIKDYVEVNSAISLALMGLNVGVSGMNFKQTSLKEQLANALKVDINPDKKGKAKSLAGNLLTNDLSQPLDKTEKTLIRVAAYVLILFIIYCFFAGLINKQMENKSKEAQKSITNTNSQIQLAQKDNSSIKEATSRYTEMIQNLQEINDKIADANSTKKAIPNLLTALMSGIPDNVQIVSIQNTSGKHIEIVAQSTQYDQLGFLRAKIKTDGILTNVTSTAGEKSNDIITVKIEGELP